ncbi:MAG: prolipoprotein diacylglyceryl transferase [Blastocatellia bacterium]|nr:prolipoprotein diacylglyceryl transferase [Blastocatellia bacterium]
MFPELFRIPIIDFTVSTYGLMLAISFISGLALAARLAASEGHEKAKIYDIGLYMLIAVIVGSKLLMVVTEWDSFVADPKRFISLEFFRSAGVYYGGFLAAFTLSFYLAAIYKIDWWSLADFCAPGVAIGQFFGRLGCFAAGCCWGKPTNSWIGVEFTNRAHELTGVPIGVHLHPTQLYESAITFLITLLLLFLHARRRFRGQIILAYIASYSIGRFIIEFYRDDPRGDLFGLSTSQLISLLLAPAALAVLIYRLYRSRRERELSEHVS